MKIEKIERYPIVTLCGSSTQKTDWEHWQREFALKGNVVLAINIYLGLEKPDYNVEDETKNLLRDLHRQKISMADRVCFILKPNGSLGKHTNEELEYAKKLNKPVTYVHSISNECSSQRNSEKVKK